MRTAKALPDEAVARLRAKGGRPRRPALGIGKVLGTSKSTTHRLLHQSPAPGWCGSTRAPVGSTWRWRDDPGPPAPML